MTQLETQREIIFKTEETNTGNVFGSCKRCDFFGILPFVQGSKDSFKAVSDKMKKIHSFYVTKQGTLCPCNPTIEYDGPQTLT